LRDLSALSGKLNMKQQKNAGLIFVSHNDHNEPFLLILRSVRCAVV